MYTYAYMLAAVHIIVVMRLLLLLLVTEMHRRIRVAILSPKWVWLNFAPRL